MLKGFLAYYCAPKLLLPVGEHLSGERNAPLIGRQQFLHVSHSICIVGLDLRRTGDVFQVAARN
jgi:hypothetical protein